MFVTETPTTADKNADSASFFKSTTTTTTRTMEETSMTNNNQNNNNNGHDKMDSLHQQDGLIRNELDSLVAASNNKTVQSTEETTTLSSFRVLFSLVQSSRESISYKLSLFFRQLGERWSRAAGVEEIALLKQQVDDAARLVDVQNRELQQLRTQLQQDTAKAEQLTARHQQFLALHKEGVVALNTEEDIRQFALLTAEESRARQKAHVSYQSLTQAEGQLDRLQVAYMNALRQRYHEEQVWQDKWRVLGTYWTWLLIALNSVVFVTTQILHWRREEHRIQTIQHNIQHILLQEFPQSLLPLLQQYILQTIQQQQQQDKNQPAEFIHSTTTTTTTAPDKPVYMSSPSDSLHPETTTTTTTTATTTSDDTTQPIHSTLSSGSSRLSKNDPGSPLVKNWGSRWQATFQRLLFPGRQDEEILAVDGDLATRGRAIAQQDWMPQLHWPSIAVGAVATTLVMVTMSCLKPSSRN